MLCARRAFQALLGGQLALAGGRELAFQHQALLLRALPGLIGLCSIRCGVMRGVNTQQ